MGPLPQRTTSFPVKRGPYRRVHELSEPLYGYLRTPLVPLGAADPASRATACKDPRWRKLSPIAPS